MWFSPVYHRQQEPVNSGSAERKQTLAGDTDVRCDGRGVGAHPPRPSKTRKAWFGLSAVSARVLPIAHRHPVENDTYKLTASH